MCLCSLHCCCNYLANSSSIIVTVNVVETSLLLWFLLCLFGVLSYLCGCFVGGPVYEL